ncbi:MAG: translation elongation factor Ts [Alphaproteobacteria bacterium]|nr:translation elongation factor Ts [Alphaproteobacteria bacterium]
MAAITAALVKELREKSGAGMMDCKKALTETGGDVDAAVDWLRTKGLAAAQKKSGRVAAEGLVGVAQADGKAAMVEVNSETDFVARNEHFQQFVKTVAELSLNAGGDIEALKGLDYPGTGRTVAEELTHLIATIGENMNLRRTAVIEASPGDVAAYVHAQAAPGLGKIGVLVGIASDGDKAKLAELGKQVAMHVAAIAPQSLDVDSLDPAAVERERSVLVDQAKASGRPENIIEKMVEGRIRKFYQEVVLLEQAFVIDGKTRVGDVVDQLGKDLGTSVKLAAFERFALGEGIEKEEDDFAAEVAAAAGKS